MKVFESEMQWWQTWWSSTEGHLPQKCQIREYQNKDRLWVSRILLLQRKLNWVTQNPQLGRPWAGCSWARYEYEIWHNLALTLSVQHFSYLTVRTSVTTLCRIWLKFIM